MELTKASTSLGFLQNAKLKVQAMFHALLHPFDGFYECKHRGLKSVPLAVIGILLYGIVATIKHQYTGFIINTNAIHRMNSFTISVSAISVIVLFIIANWTITTLFEGKGFLSDILMVVGYALYPVLIMELIVVLLSNFVIMDEVMLLRTLAILVWAWFAFVVLAGLITVHEYTLGRTIVTIFATAASMAIILFVFILYISLMQQVTSFFIMLAREIVRRTA